MYLYSAGAAPRGTRLTIKHAHLWLSFTHMLSETDTTLIWTQNSANAPAIEERSPERCMLSTPDLSEQNGTIVGEDPGA